MKWLKVRAETRRTYELAVPVPDGLTAKERQALAELLARIADNDLDDLTPDNATDLLATDFHPVPAAEGPERSYLPAYHYAPNYLQALDRDQLLRLHAEPETPAWVRDHARDRLRSHHGVSVDPPVRHLEVTVLYADGTWRRQVEATGRESVHEGVREVTDRLRARPGVSAVISGAFVPAADPPRRTRKQVLAERATVAGCCERHADNKGCDCLERAAPD